MSSTMSRVAPALTVPESPFLHTKQRGLAHSEAAAAAAARAAVATAHDNDDQEEVNRESCCCDNFNDES